MFTNRRLNVSALPFVAGLIAASCSTTGNKDLVQTNMPPIEMYSTPNRESVMYDTSTKKVWTKADQQLKETKETETNVAALLNRAQFALLEGRNSDAEKIVRSALALDLKNNKARRILAQVFFKKGQIDSAEIALTALGENVTKDAEALNLQALIALKRNKPSQAMALFKKALTVTPGNAAVRMNLGVLYLTYRQINAAAVQFERILADHPEHLDAKFHLAVARSAMGNPQYSRKVYEEVLDAYDDHPLALFNLAILQAGGGEFDDAISNLKTYLRTEHAKSSNNKEVFAMIDEFEREKSSLASGTSDEDIQKMAAKSIQEEPTKKTASAANSNDLYGDHATATPAAPSKETTTAPVKTEATTAAPAAQAPAAKTERTKKPASVDADIDMLQKELSK